MEFKSLKYYNLYHKLVFILFLILLFIVGKSVIKYLYTCCLQYEEWNIGDWLINYNAGFVRRGLGGYLILNISDFSGVGSNYITFVFHCIFYLGFLLILAIIAYEKEISWPYLLLMISPAGLLMPTNDSNMAGRKEILGFFIFAFYVLLHKNTKIRNFSFYFLYSILLSFVIFVHELTYFYIPYYILICYINSRESIKKFIYKGVLLLLLPTLSMIIIYIYGKNLNCDVICAGLIKRGIPHTICDGMISWPNSYDFRDVWLYACSKNHFLMYSLAFVLGSIPYLIYVFVVLKNEIKLATYFKILLCLYGFTIPLFVLAIDWGRWIYIHFIFQFIIATYMLPNLKQELKSSIIVTTVPEIFGNKNTIRLVCNFIVFGFLALCYAKLWRMDHSSNDQFFVTYYFYDILDFFNSLNNN